MLGRHFGQPQCYLSDRVCYGHIDPSTICLAVELLYARDQQLAVGETSL